MKPKAKPQSKIPTTQKNTNQKKKVSPADPPLDRDTSLLKKNEFTLIIAGALVVTVLVFFLFFRTSGNHPQKVVPTKAVKTGAGMDPGMEKRVAELELALAKLASSPTPEDLDGAASPKGLAGLEQRVGRIETAMTLKMDSLIERMARMERQISALKRKLATQAAIVSKPKTPKKAPVKKKVVQKKPTQTTKQSSLFHTVQKGETLWSISQKYKTTVGAIRTLNNFSAKDKIYPGNNILVR